MKLESCDFEETEYRGPLFNQLETSNLLWEPGQVFEKHIGIDRALWTSHAYLHALHGHGAPLPGVVLSRYAWDYIWAKRKRTKKLPSFRLNVFIQAKRPEYGRRAPKALRENGLRSPFWRFEITPHQQVALEKLQAKLKKRAIVCYACPVFHRDHLLYRWTIEPEIVAHSTFPDVAALTGHSAWNFCDPGASGVANAEPLRIEGRTLLERVGTLIQDGERADSSPNEELQLLAGAVHSAMETDSSEATFLQARLAEGIRAINEMANDLSVDQERQALIAYGTVLLFAYLHRLNWFVAGHGG